MFITVRIIINKVVIHHNSLIKILRAHQQWSNLVTGLNPGFADNIVFCSSRLLFLCYVWRFINVSEDDFRTENRNVRHKTIIRMNEIQYHNKVSILTLRPTFQKRTWAPWNKIKWKWPNYCSAMNNVGSSLTVTFMTYFLTGIPHVRSSCAAFKHVHNTTRARFQ